MTLGQKILADYLSGMRQSVMARKYVMREEYMMEILRSTPGYKKRKRKASRPSEQFWPGERRWALLALYAEGNSVASVAKAMKTNKRGVCKILAEEGIEVRSQSEAQTGKHNGFWHGGRTMLGRYLYLYAPNHPHATKGGYVSEHRLVMESSIGRYLEPDEVVHHKDGNPANNEIGNLQLFASNADHLAFELKGRTPQWTEDGLARINAGIQKSLERRRSASRSKGDAYESQSAFGQMQM